MLALRGSNAGATIRLARFGNNRRASRSAYNKFPNRYQSLSGQQHVTYGNVFVYRRPPPWKLTRHSDNADPEMRLNFSHAKEDISSWPEITNKTLTLEEIPNGQDKALIPELAHGLDVVLRGDGLHALHTPWSLHIDRKQTRPHQNMIAQKQSHPFYDKDYVRKIVQPRNIAWSNIPSYIPAARDLKLHSIADKIPRAKYCSSTSSISPAIASLYHLISNYRDTNLLGGLSAQLADLPSDFSKFHRRPVAFKLSKNTGDRTVYSLNAHAGSETGPSILRDLGHSMERMLTTSPTEFARKYIASGRTEGEKVDTAGFCRASVSDHAPGNSEEQFYHYSQASQFVLRAQIDCRNGKTGEVFDVKTRAVAKIRYDLDNYAKHVSHKLRYLKGKNNSYEREFYDMVRTVFLKYALQLRIGRMAGALVAYHNTTEVQGIEYISLREIESYTFGNERWADIAFGTTIRLLEYILSTVTQAMEDSDDDLKVILYTEWSKLKMYIFVQRIKRDEIDVFGSQEFERRDKEEGVAEKKKKKSMMESYGHWHLDSQLHNKGSGVSIVGDHSRIQELGGEWVARKDPIRSAKRKSPSNSEVFNHLNFDVSEIAGEDLRVWELKVVPLVNKEKFPRRNICLNDNDSFTLKYCIKEVTDMKTEHFSKFVSGLARIYLR